MSGSRNSRHSRALARRRQVSEADFLDFVRHLTNCLRQSLVAKFHIRIEMPEAWFEIGRDFVRDCLDCVRIVDEATRQPYHLARVQVDRDEIRHIDLRMELVPGISERTIAEYYSGYLCCGVPTDLGCGSRQSQQYITACM